jgi:opacity protein-like surface antigen
LEAAILNFSAVNRNGSSTKDGWLIGGGVEYGFKPHWTVGLEYDYLAIAIDA